MSDNFINAADYGVVCDGITNNTSNLNSVFALASTGGVKTISIPAGICIVNSGILNGYPNLKLIGQGMFATILKTVDTTGDLLTVDGGSVISDIGFDSAVTRISGAFIRPKKTSSGNLVILDRVAMANAYQGVNYDSSIVALTINDCTMYAETSDDIASNSGGICITGGGIVAINNLIHGPGPSSDGNKALFVVRCGAGNVTMNGGQYLENKHGILVNPTDNEVAFVSVQGTWIDRSSSIPVLVKPTGTGAVAFFDFSSPWTAASSGNALEIDQTGNTSVTFINVHNSNFRTYASNSGSGIYLSGLIGAAARFSDNLISGFSWGLGISPNTGNFHINDNTFVNNGGPAVVVQSGTSNNYSIQNNLFLGTTGGISDSGTGVNKLVTNNH